MSKPHGTQLNCFSPPVMLATLVIETSLAVYTVWRYKLTPLVRLAVTTLIALASFQLAEFFVCTGYNHHPIFWSKLGFVMITALPPLGVHIMHVLAKKPQRTLVLGAYATMLAFMAFFLLTPTAFSGHQCTGNYVIFQFSSRVTGTYSLYYYGWLLISMYLGVRWSNELLRTKGKAARARLQAVRALIVGYLVFLIPVAVVNSIKPSTRQGIPSIMCGFAVLFALILILYILPKASRASDLKA